MSVSLLKRFYHQPYTIPQKCQIYLVYWYMYMKVKHLYLNRGKLKKIAEQLN